LKVMITCYGYPRKVMVIVILLCRPRQNLESYPAVRKNKSYLVRLG
jgi:hypothetical protein